MQENKISILSTRPVEPIWISRAAGQGILLDTVSFIETEAMHGKELEEGIRILATKPATVIFTSMNAVNAVADFTGKWTLEGVKAPEWAIYCIGHATRELAARHFGEASIRGTADSALALADKLIEKEVAGEIVFFCGDQRRDELPDRLNRAGIRITEMIVYLTKLKARRLERHYDGILFFSPSAVHSFFSANQAGAGTRLFAIGSTTAAAIRSYSTNPVIQSESPAKEALVRQALDHFTRGTIREGNP